MIKPHSTKFIYHSHRYHSELFNRCGVIIATTILVGLIALLTKGKLQEWLGLSNDNIYKYLTLLGINIIVILYFHIKAMIFDSVPVRSVNDIPAHYQNIGNYKVGDITLMVDRNNADKSYNDINFGYLDVSQIKQHLRQYRYRVLILSNNDSEVKYYQSIPDILINNQNLKYYRYHAENEIRPAS